ncbi:MAG: type II toxin-antitoxin system RelE/ParE family toxin [Parvularculaceae bacterium]
MDRRLRTVVETQEFAHRAKGLQITDAERTFIVNAIAADPECGVPLGGGLRKARFAGRSSGKSGGYRTLHFFRREELPVFLLSIFAKNEKANLSKKELADLIGLCDEIAEHYGSRK